MTFEWTNSIPRHLPHQMHSFCHETDKSRYFPLIRLRLNRSSESHFLFLMNGLERWTKTIYNIFWNFLYFCCNLLFIISNVPILLLTAWQSLPFEFASFLPVERFSMSNSCEKGKLCTLYRQIESTTNNMEWVSLVTGCSSLLLPGERRLFIKNYKIYASHSSSCSMFFGWCASINSTNSIQFASHGTEYEIISFVKWWVLLRAETSRLFIKYSAHKTSLQLRRTAINEFLHFLRIGEKEKTERETERQFAKFRVAWASTMRLLKIAVIVFDFCLHWNG